jgi:DNA-directed RNA polymerase subunit M/transcription elongation factor TFIIS
MHFCKKCGNMFYIRLTSSVDDNLIYYCRKCGNENSSLAKNTKNICVSKTHITSGNMSYKNIVNKFTKMDPTLPRINTIKCPNSDCTSNLEKTDKLYDKNEILYIRYDDTNMKFIYLCSNCDNMWKNVDNT